MKVFFTLICLFSISVHAQDPKVYLAAFDSKMYSLKAKGVKDFVVDVESSKLTKQMNDQMIFGKVKSLVFRVFWTASPERLAVDIIGLPEGFREIKEELKLNLVSGLDNLLPMSVLEKFHGYKMMKGPNPKEFIAQVNGFGVVEQVKIIIDQNSENSESKPIKVEETLQFKNYKLNTGEGVKYFLGDTLKK